MNDAYQALSERLRDRAFTPGVRDVAELFERWRAAVLGASTKERRALAKLMVRSLGGADRPVATRLLRDVWELDDGEQRALTVRVLARIASRLEVPEWTEALGRLLGDPEPRVVREGLRAVAKLDEGAGLPFEEVVIEQLLGAALPEQRAAADCLGKVGGERALGVLRDLISDDGELMRRREQAITLLERRRARGQATEIQIDAPLSEATAVVLRCRRGMERFAKEQAESLLGARASEVAIDPLGVALRWSGGLRELGRVRIAMDAALVFALAPGPDLHRRIVDALCDRTLIGALRDWTRGPLRFRLSLLDGSTRRALVRSVASTLRHRDAPLANDSREAPWTIHVDIEGSRLLCVPRDVGLRFDYTRALVPAASHPTLAALMAWVGRPRPKEVVWDPFCGSAGELIECGRLEPSARLYGTDVDAAAIAAAARNLEAAGLVAELTRADALRSEPSATPSLIITNPPMGRRVASGYKLHDLLRRFVGRAATLLPPQGRLVWVTPAAQVSAEAGRGLGLGVEDHGVLDLDGLGVHLQVMTR